MLDGWTLGKTSKEKQARIILVQNVDMTFQELTDWLGNTLIEGDWRQCPIGLGWIHVDSKVSTTAAVEGCIQSGACVGDRAIIGQKSSVGPQVIIGERVVIESQVNLERGAVVGNWATLSKGAIIEERVKIGERANIGRGSHLKMGVVIGEGAYVDAGTVWHESPLYIIGTKFPVFQPRPGFMQITCQSHSLYWWEIHGRKFAEQSGFTPGQILEYESYLELFKRLTKA